MIDGPATRPTRVRDRAEWYLLLMIVSFAIAVVGIRWFLDATGYPQVGGGELHIAHMLWGGLLLVLAVTLVLIADADWAYALAAVGAGAGTGLFIDEVGKFITASNDYFYPLAAPLIYGVLLVLVLVFVVVRRRPGAEPASHRPARVGHWEEAHLPQRRYRRILVAFVGLLGLGWSLSALIYMNLDSSIVRELIDSLATQPGRIERPSDPLFYGLETAILGVSGLLLLAGAVLLARGSDHHGTTVAIVGLAIALTAGALVSLYVEQVSAISATVINAVALLLVLHYRNRFAGASPSAEPHDPTGLADAS
jgi:hypothetical protein